MVSPSPGSTVVPGGRAVGLGERLEQAAELLLVHADPGVGHVEGEACRAGSRLRAGQREGHGPVLREFRRVAQQVDQALLELGEIGAHGADVWGAFDNERVAVLLHQRFDDRANLIDQPGEIDLLEIDVHAAGFDLRKIEDAVDQPQQVLAGSLDLLQIADGHIVAAIGGVLDQDLAVADDGVERRAQLVAHIGEESRLRARGGLGFGAGLLRLVLGGADVAGIVAEYGERPAHVPELVAVGRGKRGRQVAAGDRQHGGREIGQPPHDVAQHEQPDDQTGQDETGGCDQDQPQPAGVDRLGRQRRGAGRLALGAVVELRNLLAQVDPDRLQRRLLRGDSLPFRQEPGLDRQQTVVGGADGSQRPAGVAKFAHARGRVRRQARQALRQAVGSGGELLAQSRQGIGSLGSRDPVEQGGDAIEIGARGIGGAQRRKIALQVGRVALAAHPPIDARAKMRQDIVRDLQQQAQPALVDGLRLVDCLGAPIPEQENLAGRAVELADIGVDRGDHLLQPRRGCFFRDDHLQLAEDAPELADLIGQALHALETLRLVFRLAEFRRQHDEFGGLGFDAERQLDQRKTDPGQAVEDRVDLIEADEREQGRAHGQRGDERKGEQQVAGDALIPGPAARHGREVARCRHFGSSCWTDDALIPGIAIR